MFRKATTRMQRRDWHRPCFMIALILCLLTCSCRHRYQLPKYVGHEHSAAYIDRATQIGYIDTRQPISSKVNFAMEPRRIRNEQKDEIWELSLGEVIQTTLRNSKVIRRSADFLNPGNPLLSNPEFVQSIYNPAIQESGVLFGRRGVEAALSDFDAQFTTQLLFGGNETIQNNRVSIGVDAGDELDETNDSFNMSLQKRLATGGQVSVSHNWTHTGRNIDNSVQLFTTVYEGVTRFQFRQPLWAGAGAEYTRIAGPISANIQGVTGVQQGVLIARIENDKELADFESAVQQLVHDVEELYWQLHLAYIQFDVLVEGREAANRVWNTLDAQAQAGTGSGGTTEAEVRQIYLDSKSRADLARNNIYEIEARLRLLMGLPVNDGRIIRPSDTPITAEILPDWQQALTDALVERPEIRRQKWEIRSLQLQRKAAENLLMPRLDFVSAYQFNAFGDELFGHRNDTNPAVPGHVDHAYESLFTGDQTGWNLGLEFSLPLGRRFAKAQVRSLELQLAKAQAILGEQEVELSHEVASAFRDLDRNYLTMENSYNSLLAAQSRRDLVRAQYKNDSERYPIESVLRAEQAFGQAKTSLASAVTEYNITLANMHFITGQSLKESNITLIEGPWHQAAKTDAREEFEARKHALPADYKEHGPALAPYYGTFE